jgi:hypothetical protein
VKLLRVVQDFLLPLGRKVSDGVEDGLFQGHEKLACMSSLSAVSACPQNAARRAARIDPVLTLREE